MKSLILIDHLDQLEAVLFLTNPSHGIPCPLAIFLPNVKVAVLLGYGQVIIG